MGHQPQVVLYQAVAGIAIPLCHTFKAGRLLLGREGLGKGIGADDMESKTEHMGKESGQSLKPHRKLPLWNDIAKALQILE